MKQTATEWLEEQISMGLADTETIKKAKEKEKQNIINARLEIGLYKELSYDEALLEAEDYYNKTFKNK